MPTGGRKEAARTEDLLWHDQRVKLLTGVVGKWLQRGTEFDPSLRMSLLPRFRLNDAGKMRYWHNSKT